MEEFQLIYGLQPFNGGVFYFYPEAYIAKVKNGRPTYMEKIGTADVISSYGIDVKGTIHESALAFCKEIHPATLMEKYKGKQTKVISVVQLFEDVKIKTVLSRKVEDVLSAFLVLSDKHKLPVYFHIQRKVYLEDIRLSFSPVLLKPLLRFEKTATGTNYYLYLCLDDRRIIPSHFQIELIGDLPARIIHEGFVYLVEDVNGAKLRPFLKQEKIFIPERITFEYFNKFIKDVVGTTQIEVEGYDFEEKSSSPVPVIRFGESFHSGAPEVILSFVYEKARFVYGDRSRHKVIIRAEVGNAIGVAIYRRREDAENDFVQALHKLHLSETAALRFEVADSGDDYATLQRVLQNLQVLKDKGFVIELPRIEGRQVSCAEVIRGKFEHELKNDWFDLNLYICVGDHQISFASLLMHIRNKQRLFVLTNGEVFIIPLEWMEKYETLARHAVVEGREVKLAKVRHSVLNELTEPGAESKLEDIEFEVPHTIQALLRPYQIEGARWLAHHHVNGLGACLADDMGLGKTLQTLTLLCYVKEGLKTELKDKTTQLRLFDDQPVQRTALQALIVVPSSLVFNWLAEIRKFAPSLIAVNHTGADRSKDFKNLKTFDIIITSYQTLLRDEGLFSKINFLYIVLDEAHYIKNRESKIFQVVRSLKTHNRISLSGTPIENSLADMWSQMEFINPSILQSYAHFKKHYQDAIEKQKDETVLMELKMLVSPYILRRTKAEVLKDLPDLEEQIFYSVLPETQRKLIEAEKSRARNALMELEYGIVPNTIHVLNALMKLRQLANHPRLVDKTSKVESGKYEDIINTIETLTLSGNKILVFSSFVSHLNLYKSFLDEKQIRYVSLTGENSQDERSRAVQQFNEDRAVQVFLISLKAGGVGINLMAANYVLILDPWWNPFAEKQAIARAHRMGQEQKVTVIRFIAVDTIEEKILNLQKNKLSLATEMIDEHIVPDLDEEMMGYLLRDQG